MKARKHGLRWSTALLLIAALLLAACGGGGAQTADPGSGSGSSGSPGSSGSSGGGTQSEAKPPIKIGQVQSLSGALQNYGMQARNGFELGLEWATNGTMEVAGRKIEVIVEDDGTDPAMAAQKTKKLLEEDNVDIIQGPSSSPNALSMIPLVTQAKKILVVDPANSDAITGSDWTRYVFRTGRSASQDAATAAYAVEKLGKKWAFLAIDNTFGQTQVAAWEANVTQLGGEVVHIEYPPEDTTDFTSYINRVKQSGADVFLPVWSGTGAVMLFTQMGELRVGDTMTVWTGVGDIPSLRAMGLGLEGAWGPAYYFHLLPDNEVNDWLVEQHKAKHNGEPPDLFTAGGFASAVAIVRALEQTGGDTDAEKLIAAMEGLTFETPKGPMTFRPEDHQAMQVMYIAELKQMDGYDYLVPTLIAEMSAEETEPPIMNNR